MSDTVMLAARLSCAVEHHTASLKSICNRDSFNSSFHAQAIVWSSPGDIAMIQLPKGPNFLGWHMSKNFAAGVSRAARNKYAAQGSPCGTNHACRIHGVTISSSFTNVSEFLYSLIQAAISTGGTPMVNIALMFFFGVRRDPHRNPSRRPEFATQQPVPSV